MLSSQSVLKPQAEAPAQQMMQQSPPRSDQEGVAPIEYLPYEDLSKQYPHGYSTDPLDRRPYELSAKCYYCTKSFSIENQVKNFIVSKNVWFLLIWLSIEPNGQCTETKLKVYEEILPVWKSSAELFCVSQFLEHNGLPGGVGAPEIEIIKCDTVRTQIINFC